jgi:hypothetical protein
MIHRDVKKTLNLMCVKVYSQNAASTRRFDKIRGQLCTDRHPWLILPILSTISVIWDYSGDARRRGPLRRIDQEKKLHDVVGGRVSGLDDEHIPSPSIFVDPDKDLPIGEVVNQGPIHRLFKDLSDLLRERLIRPPGEKKKWPSPKSFVHLRPSLSR